MAKQWHQLERLDHKSLKKLQQDREKQALAQKALEERKKLYIAGGAIAFAVILALVFWQVISKRAEMRQFQEERSKLLFSKVLQFGGKAFFRSLGDWEMLDKPFSFDKEYTFKSEKEGFVVNELQLKNQLKLASGSEMVVPPPELEEKINKVKRERVVLTRGEVTASVGVDGRELLEVEAGGIVAMGASGLFKVLFNAAKNSGEVVVKNGLVEVFTRDSPQKRVKVSGFYKVVFSKGQYNSPSQASIIQYDWR